MDKTSPDSSAKLHVIPFVVITIISYAALFLLNCLRKRFRKRWLKLLSWACYVLIPIFISYTIGLLEAPEAGRTDPYVYILLTMFILFGYSSFDNLICFSLQERNNRTILFFQFTIQVILLLRYTRISPSDVIRKGEIGLIFPSVLVFIVVCFKVMERIAALAHASGKTVGIRGNLRRIVNYTNMDEEDRIDPVTMEGFKLLVGPRYSKIEDDKIVDGISLEKIWGVLSSRSSRGKLKDTFLSFTLFWLLLGKFYGYPLYKGRSKEKAWRLVHESLVGDRGEHERVFRVIEVELCFLSDYFYTKYFFFYLNGIWWKLYLLAFLFVVYFFRKLFFVDILLSLEVVQIGMFICSRWFRVILITYVAKRKGSKKNNRLVTWCIEKVVAAISRFSLCTSTIFGKPWKRELDQYSLLKSCTSFGMDNNSCIQAVLGTGLGIPIPKPGRKLGSSVALSEDVKRAVILSLNKTGPRLSNGVASLRRNEVDNELSWACKLSKDAEVILVWHIATSICEMSHTPQQHTTQSLVDMNVATRLSKYCAYLLAFSPSLLPIPLHEAELTCDNAIRDAAKLLNKCNFLCFKTKETNKYEKLMDSLRGERVTRNGTSVLQRGVRLGEQLVSTVGDEERRWKIVAELWAEMILFLAPSNSNELVHAEKLDDGGEFITLLWALLIHAGVVNREDLIWSPHTEDEAGLDQSGYV